MAFEHAVQVRSIVGTLIRIAPNEPEIEDFEEQYRREPFFAAQATLRGLAVELCILLMFWLSKDPSSPLVVEPRNGLSNSSNIRNFFDGQLRDRAAAGRIPARSWGVTSAIYSISARTGLGPILMHCFRRTIKLCAVPPGTGI